MKRRTASIHPGHLDLLEAALVSAAGEPQRARRILDRVRARPTEQRELGLEKLVKARVAEAEGDFGTALTAWREILEPTDERFVLSVDFDVWPLYEIGRIEHDHGDPAAARAALDAFSSTGATRTPAVDSPCSKRSEATAPGGGAEVVARERARQCDALATRAISCGQFRRWIPASVPGVWYEDEGASTQRDSLRSSGVPGARIRRQRAATDCPFRPCRSSDVGAF